MIRPQQGNLLIANPHLDDPNFLRSVILLCEHNSEGSVGFVLNHKTSYTIEDIIPDFSGFKNPIYEGGPVELNTLHYIHQYPDITGAIEITNNIFWGGEFDEITQRIFAKKIEPQKIKFFLGYSGWGESQLNFEMDEKTWIITNATKNFLFSDNDEDLWKMVLKSMGGEYEWIVNAPINPQLN